MSRVIARNTVGGNTPVNEQKGQREISTHAMSAVKIFGLFFTIKQKDNYRAFLTRCKKYSLYRKKISQLLCTQLTNLQTRKTKSHLAHSLRKLLAHKASQLRLQLQHFQSRTQTIKSKGASLIAILYNKLEKRRLRDTLETVGRRGRVLGKLRAFRDCFLGRVFGGLVRARLRVGFQGFRVNRVGFLWRKMGVVRLAKIFQGRKQSNLMAAFAKLIQHPSKQAQEKPQPASQKPQLSKGSRVTRTQPQKPPQPISSSSPDQKQVLEQKNTKLSLQLQTLQQKNTQELESYRLQITSLQAEHESLKFNNGILDQAIQQLESEIIQKQKKSRKGMPIAELWERVYSNFLLLLSRYGDGQESLSKERVLEFLEMPLVPLNVDVQGLRAENQVLGELLGEYRKFYQGTQLPEIQNSGQEMLPYDILVAKNKFLYLTIETLIRQGLGSEIEVKQLQLDLDNVAKQA